MTQQLAGKVILITGAASGIGRATARLVASQGGMAVATDLGSADSIQKATELGDEHLFLSVDVTQEGALQSAVASTMSRYGQLSGAVACAGIVASGSVHSLARADWERALEVHLTGSFLTCKHVLKPMLAAHSGSIVTISSIYGMTGCAGNTPYNVAKGGVLQLMRTLSAEYAPHGIRSNAVSPGMISTPMTETSMGQATEAFIRMHPLGRSGRPEEVAAGIAFLLSDAASFISGVNLPIDGGFSGSKSLQWEGAA